jgi:hypothetical protein
VAYLTDEKPIPLCERCGHKATMHVVDDEERRECMEWCCNCEQYEHPIVPTRPMDLDEIYDPDHYGPGPCNRLGRP